MITTFNPGDMIKFANHISNLILEGKKQTDPNGKYRITRAEFVQWKDSQVKH